MNKPMIIPRDVETNSPETKATSEASSLGRLIHSLSNKLLPIVVFSELALRRCDDTQLKPQLEKIHGAAEQARDILIQIRALQGKSES